MRRRRVAPTSRPVLSMAFSSTSWGMDSPSTAATCRASRASSGSSSTGPRSASTQRLGVGAFDLVVGCQLERHEGVAVAQLDDPVVVRGGQPHVATWRAARGSRRRRTAAGGCHVSSRRGSAPGCPAGGGVMAQSVVTAGQHEEESFLAGGAGQVVEQVEAGRVGPVDVLQHQHHRLALTDGVQDPQHAREQPRPLQADVRRERRRTTVPRRSARSRSRSQVVPAIVLRTRASHRSG